jgi:hypothetical protein
VLELSKFVLKLSGMMGSALLQLGDVRSKMCKKQGRYLDSISETLASAGMDVGAGRDITKQLAELRYHLSEIESVLRLGDSDWQMALDDGTVARLRAELDLAVSQTNFSPSGLSPEEDSRAWSERQELRSTFLNASGVFRGAAVALLGRI